MPLKSGKSNVSNNIRELIRANKNKPPGKKHSRKQIIAIALAKSRERRKKKGC